MQSDQLRRREFITLLGGKATARSITRVSSTMLQEVLVVALLLIWALFLRLPFFFPATLGWDESGFIIMGQGILDGLLPYDALWESKPPLVYAFFAAAIRLLGKTIVAVRFAGYLWVTAAAYLAYRTAYALTSERRASIAAAVLFITATSILSPEVMGETLALVPLIGALLALLTTERTMATCLSTGVLIGTAAMFRTNLAYLAVLVGLWIVFYPPIVSIPWLVVRGLIYAAGGIIVILVTAVPYLMQDRLGLWFNNLFLIPLEYSNARRSPAHVWQLALKAFGIWPDFRFDVRIFIVGCVLWIGGFLGILLRFRHWSDLSKPACDQSIILLIFLIGSALSVFLTGPTYTHYLVLLIPCCAILSVFALTHQPTAKRRLVVELGAFLCMVASSILFVSDEYSSLAQRVKENKSLSYGPEYEIARYLRQENPDRKPVFLPFDIIVYWFISQYPITRLSTHPSNIFRRYLVTAVEGPNATPESEMHRILSWKPAFIVKKKHIWYLEGQDAARMLTDTLDRDYVLTNIIDEREIYRLK
jgi:4-amino-4-deoxy-L-arabinose transferase-like glycosyltransferase